MGPRATYYYGASPWVTSLQEHEERAQVTSSYNQWRSAQDSLLQEFDRLHPGRVRLRMWLIKTTTTIQSMLTARDGINFCSSQANILRTVFGKHIYRSSNP
jgi:hypothetical protein